MTISNNNEEATVKDIVGLVIAGGRARRLGQDKHAAKLGKRLLIDHVADRLAQQVENVAVNLRSDNTYERYPVITERETDRGPLAAVSVGFKWARSLGAKYLVTMPVDVPFFPLDFVSSLFAANKLDAPCFAQSRQQHGLCAMWPVSMQCAFDRAFMDCSVCAVHRMHEILGSAPVVFSDLDQNAFMNINTQEELSAANLLLKKMR